MYPHWMILYIHNEACKLRVNNYNLKPRQKSGVGMFIPHSPAFELLNELDIHDIIIINT